MNTRASDYDYDLPRELIAQYPTPDRSEARLLVAERATQSLAGRLRHLRVSDLPDILRPGDLLVVNESQVVPARLVGQRTRTGGRWEGLFLGEETHGAIRLMCKCRGKLAAGESITIRVEQGEEYLLALLEDRGQGVWIAKPMMEIEPLEFLRRAGRVPLPPYIRGGAMVPSDRQRYQTIFAREPGSVAAPTAGLHFTEELLDRLGDAGVGVAKITLHVGAGTFRPIATESLDDHKMHEELFHIPEETVSAFATTRSAGGRVLAVGTTTVRTLESAMGEDGRLLGGGGGTDLFIRPGFRFRAVDALMTNFHLPRSTLLVLVHAFGGNELIHRAYREAIDREYRFYSYGDAMLVL